MQKLDIGKQKKTTVAPKKLILPFRIRTTVTVYSQITKSYAMARGSGHLGKLELQFLSLLRV